MTDTYSRGRALVVPVSILLVVLGLGLAAAPSGSAPAEARGGSAGFVQLDSFYSLKLHNSNEGINANGVLSGIKETSGGTISGSMSIESPLFGSGPFTGTVGTTAVNFTVQSTVPNPCDCVSLVFTGTVNAHGTMGGTYVGNTTGGSENGTWSASRHATFNCKIRARANHQYVTTEVVYPGAAFKGLLRARSNTVGTWQEFRCVAVGTKQWALKSRANHKFVTAEVNYAGGFGGLLRAQSTKISAWERFTFQDVGACSCFALKAANSKFVTVDPSTSDATRGILRAHGPRVGLRQEFDVTSG